MLRYMLLLAAMLVLAAPGSSAAATPRVAVVYSSWGGYGFKDEFDGHLQALGWSFEKFENTQLPKLTERLGEFDMVIATGVANLEHPVDLAPYKEQWLAFLRRGGSLIVTDASYDTTIGQWVGRLGPDFALTSAGCAPFTKAHGGSDAVVCDKVDTLLHAPVELAALIQAKGGIWAHLDTWGAGWSNLVKCADDKSLLVARNVGSGCVVVTSYFRFSGDATRALATGLLTNVWMRTRALRSGVEVLGIDLGRAAPGKRTVTVRLKRTDPEIGWAKAAVRVCGTHQSQARPFSPGPEPLVLSVQTNLTQRGDVQWQVTIEPQGKAPLTLEQRMHVPEAVQPTVAERHVYKNTPVIAGLANLTPPMDAKPEALTVELRLDGTLVLQQRNPSATVSSPIYMKHLALGKHTFSATLKEGDKVLGEGSADFWRHPEPTVGVRPDGTILVKRKPFFPFGWYHVSWAFDAEHRLRFLRDIAAAGYNAVHAGVKTVDEWQTFLDEAQKLNVKVVTEFGVDPIQVITRYKDHPAVLAWNPGDEPDGTGTSAEEMASRQDRFKQADPNHPSYMTLCVPSSYARYAGAADIIAPDPYPLPSSPTSVVYDCISSASAEAAKHHHGLIAIPQCFGYPDSGWSRVPNYDEVRNMTYLALLGGAKGIIYYVYDDGRFRVTDHPELWAAMKTMPREITALQDFVLNGLRAKVETGSKELYAGTWRLGGRTLVCVVNTNAKAELPVKLALPGKLKSTAPLLPDMKPALSLAGSEVTGTLSALGVWVGVAR